MYPPARNQVRDESLAWDETWGWLKPDAEGWREIHVIGTRSGKDPDARQRELKRMTVGEPVFVRREPLGRQYKDNISVYSVREVQVGYLEEKRTKHLAPAMDRGLKIEAVSAVSPDPDAFLVGLWILAREDRS